MRIVNVTASNFASYKKLEFFFNYTGLSLIHGSTGSGKSTLCDLIPWTIFGKTSKNGSADDIISWQGGVTTATVALYLSSGAVFNICRVRGKPKDNDLYFYTDRDPNITRGKDLQDTQRIINNKLRFSYELYLSGAYFHEFSQTAQFFITTPKNRRSICEQLVDLSLPLKLQDKIKDNAKIVTKAQDFIVSDIKMTESNIQMLTKLQDQENTKFDNWELQQQKKVDQATNNALRFEDNRTIRINQIVEASKIKAKSKICSECGSVKTMETHRHQDNNTEIKRIENEVNPYIEQIDMLDKELNPYDSGVKDFSKDIAEKEYELTVFTNTLNDLNSQAVDLEILTEATNQFRGLLIKNTILDIEAKTNVLLSNHFDAEIKIELVVEDTDKVDILITKDGNVASFTQLSKGQRCILKLCFGVSVMKAVQQHHAVRFEQIFFDEVLLGLDENMKLKAMALFEHLSLEYGSIFIVEHSEAIKAMINSKYEVQLVDGSSIISKDNS